MKPTNMSNQTYDNCDTVCLHQRERFAILEFSRPDQLNALNRVMMHESIRLLERVGQDESISLLMVTGAGKAFMAGADIKEYASFTPQEFEDFQKLGRRFYAAIEQLPQPVVAAQNGYAFGGGFEVLLASDMIVAAESALGGLPEIKLNLIPGGGGTQRAVQRLGRSRANELLMSGRGMPARVLESWGLVNKVLADAAFRENAETFCADFCRHSGAVLRSIKRMTLAAEPPPSDERLDLEQAELVKVRLRPDAETAIQAFCARSNR